MQNQGYGANLKSQGLDRARESYQDKSGTGNSPYKGMCFIYQLGKNFFHYFNLFLSPEEDELVELTAGALVTA